MGSGVGKTQKAILDALAGEQELAALTVAELAARVGIGDRQARAAVRALERRGLVVITKEHIGWKGEGQYGPLVWKRLRVDDPEGEYTRYEGSYRGVPQEGDKCGVRYKDGTAHVLGTPVKFRIEWYQERIGTPTMGLVVWLPERREQYQEAERARTEALRARLLGVRLLGDV